MYFNLFLSAYIIFAIIQFRVSIRSRRYAAFLGSKEPLFVFLFWPIIFSYWIIFKSWKK